MSVAPAPLLLLSLTCGLFFASPAFAHRLVADFKILPDKQIQIESWFETGDSPRKATVQVFGANGKLIHEGPLDEASGKFVFAYQEVETLKIVVNAPGGHRAEVTIPASAFGVKQSAIVPTEGNTSPGTEQAGGATVKDVVTGVALLFAVAAFVMSWRNGRSLRRLAERVGISEPEA